MRALGIKLSSKTAHDIIDGKRGVVAQVLYQLKSVLESLTPEQRKQGRMTPHRLTC